MSNNHSSDVSNAVKRALVSCNTLAACGLLIPLTVQAQGTPAEQQDGDARGALEEIMVTGTRIMRDGYNAPTPTSVISAESVVANAQPNIFTTVAQLPSLQGSTGTQVNTFSTSSGQQGLSSFSLRGLTAIRTLTLLDGQRVVGANVTGVTDVSMFPQLLIDRVDVVNGGASSSYGSDAVGGVVNFVTNTRFEGVKETSRARPPTITTMTRSSLSSRLAAASSTVACMSWAASSITMKTAWVRARWASASRAVATGSRSACSSIATC